VILSAKGCSQARMAENFYAGQKYHGLTIDAYPTPYVNTRPLI
jgi:hypothetical protein